MGLLFIPQVMYEHGELWWNDVEWGKLIHQSAVWQSYQQGHLVASQEDLGKGNYGFYLQNVSFILVELFNMP
jgi:hypothetical protein